MNTQNPKQSIHLDPQHTDYATTNIIRTVHHIHTANDLTIGMVRYKGIWIKVVHAYDKTWNSAWITPCDEFLIRQFMRGEIYQYEDEYDPDNYEWDFIQLTEATIFCLFNEPQFSRRNHQERISQIAIDILEEHYNATSS